MGRVPIFLGHSEAVADLCDRAAEAEGWPLDMRAVLRRAALLHDLGIVAIPTGVWEKPGGARRRRARPYALSRFSRGAGHHTNSSARRRSEGRRPPPRAVRRERLPDGKVGRPH
ncbi:MAG: HD domain-containing protein [Polyangiaceae bacterium]|nr:HD domain-containing protein [Polyangiaceae bacterium]